MRLDIGAGAVHEATGTELDGGRLVNSDLPGRLMYQLVFVKLHNEACQE